MSKDKRKREPRATELLHRIWKGHEHRLVWWYNSDGPQVKRLVSLGLIKLRRRRVSFDHISRTFLELTPAGVAAVKILTAPSREVPGPAKRNPRVEKKPRASVRRRLEEPEEDGVRAYARYIP